MDLLILLCRDLGRKVCSTQLVNGLNLEELGSTACSSTRGNAIDSIDVCRTTLLNILRTEEDA